MYFITHIFTHWKLPSSQSSVSTVQEHPQRTYNGDWQHVYTTRIIVVIAGSLVFKHGSDDTRSPVFLSGHLVRVSEVGPRQRPCVPAQHAVTQRLQVTASRRS